MCFNAHSPMLRVVTTSLAHVDANQDGQVFRIVTETDEQTGMVREYTRHGGKDRRMGWKTDYRTVGCTNELTNRQPDRQVDRLTGGLTDRLTGKLLTME